MAWRFSRRCRSENMDFLGSLLFLFPRTSHCQPSALEHSGPAFSARLLSAFWATLGSACVAAGLAIRCRGWAGGSVTYTPRSLPRIELRASCSAAELGMGCTMVCTQWCFREQVEEVDRAAGTCCLTFYLQSWDDSTHLRGASTNQVPMQVAATGVCAPGLSEDLHLPSSPVCSSGQRAARRPVMGVWSAAQKTPVQDLLPGEHTHGLPTQTGEQPGVEPGHSVDFFTADKIRKVELEGTWGGTLVRGRHSPVTLSQNQRRCCGRPAT